MAITVELFNDETISEKIDARIDAMTGPAAWQEVSALLAKVRAMDGNLFYALESAVNVYAGQQVEAAFVVGYQAATQPAPWIFEE